MAPRRRVELAGLAKLLERISSGRLEQPIAQHRAAGVRGHQRLRDQVRNAIDDIRRCDRIIRRYRPRGRQDEAARENCQAAQHDALGQFSLAASPCRPQGR